MWGCAALVLPIALGRSLFRRFRQADRLCPFHFHASRADAQMRGFRFRFHPRLPAIPTGRPALPLLVRGRILPTVMPVFPGPRRGRGMSA